MTKNESTHTRVHTHTGTTADRSTLGSTGPTVFPLGLGCMGMSALYGEADRAESIATIHAYLDATPTARTHCWTPATSTAWGTTNC